MKNGFELPNSKFTISDEANAMMQSYREERLARIRSRGGRSAIASEFCPIQIIEEYDNETARCEHFNSETGCVDCVYVSDGTYGYI